MPSALKNRLFCYSCHKPQQFCVCALAQPVQNTCSITILQHPRERRHCIGTARLARLGLRHAELIVCWQLQAPASLVRRANATWAVLFPSAQAVNLAAVGGRAAPAAACAPAPSATTVNHAAQDNHATQHNHAALHNHTGDPEVLPPQHLLVLDGTWSQARALYRANPWLGALRHVCITPAGPDRYRIRREPRADYTSTLEAIVTALGHIEPQTAGLAGLMDAFDTMIDRQVACLKIPHHGAHRPRGSKAGSHLRGIAPGLMQHPKRTIVLFAEFMQYQDGPRRHRELLYWTAQRLATGAFFGQFVRPQGFGPTPRHLEHMRLDAALLHNQAVSKTTIQHDFAAFCGSQPQFLAWNQTTLDLLRQHFNQVAPAWLLKTIFCSVRRQRGCQLEEAAAQLGAQPSLNAASGRANIRLGTAVAVAQALLTPVAPTLVNTH